MEEAKLASFSALHPVTVDTCAREPIQYGAGSIQPHGLLFVLDNREFKILQCSANCTAYFNLPQATNLIGLHFSSIIGKRQFTMFQKTCLSKLVHDQNVISPARLSMRVSGCAPLVMSSHEVPEVHPCEHTFDAIAHMTPDGLIVVELEPTRAEGEEGYVQDISTLEVQQRANQATEAFRTAKSVIDFVRTMAEHVSAVTMFDRVMAYVFDAEYNGEVVVEVTQDGVAPKFMGLRFPASDIPPQARLLYTKNRLRMIPDAEYAPTPIIPPVRPGASAPTDLTLSVLRSVSPMHIEYLKNMGVASTVTISILCNDKLWGMVCCHHSTPRFLPYSVRLFCEILGGMGSLSLEAFLRGRRAEERLAFSNILTTALDATDNHEDLAAGLAQVAHGLVDVFKADAGLFCVDGKVTWFQKRRPGREPNHALIRWLKESNRGCVFATDSVHKVHSQEKERSLSAHSLQLHDTSLSPAGRSGGPHSPPHVVPNSTEGGSGDESRSTSSTGSPDMEGKGEVSPAPEPFDESVLMDSSASGVLHISLASDGEDHITFFRSELIKTVDWGGDPHKPMGVVEAGKVRLHPRKSFGLWQEKVRWHSAPWTQTEVDGAHLLRQMVIKRMNALNLERLRSAKRGFGGSMQCSSDGSSGSVFSSDTNGLVDAELETAEADTQSDSGGPPSKRPRTTS